MYREVHNCIPSPFHKRKMGSENLKLPLIDLSNLKHQSEEEEYAKFKIRQALEEYGCFEASFDGVPLDLGKSVLDGLEQLFDLPLEIKLRNISGTPYHGYVGQVPGFPLYESLGIEEVLSPGKIESFTKLMWPEGNPYFRYVYILVCSPCLIVIGTKEIKGNYCHIEIRGVLTSRHENT